MGNLETESKAGVFVPPHSVEAEKAVLGWILTSPELFNLVIDKEALIPEHFYVDIHKKIFEIMVRLDAKGASPDLIAVSTDFASTSVDSSYSYVIELANSCPIAQNLEYYASIVKNKYLVRRVITACQDTVQRAMTANDDLQSFVENVEKEFLNISQQAEKGQGFVSAKSLLVPTIEELERRIKSEGHITGVTSGFADLDKFIGGWQKSDLIILAARPGMGKTALALNWVMNAMKASDNRYVVGVFSLEMSKTQLMERLLSAEARVDSTRMRKGDLLPDDQERILRASRFINSKGLQLFIDETPGISLGEVRSRCRRQKKEHGLDFLVVDYLQLMTGSANAQRQGREREIGEISMGLKSLAKELSIPVVALAQLNRGPDARPDKRPRMSDLRESGSMEQDADQILFIYRDEYYNPVSESAGRSEILIAKNRHGGTGSVQLAWMPQFVSFYNIIAEP